MTTLVAFDSLSFYTTATSFYIHLKYIFLMYICIFFFCLILYISVLITVRVILRLEL